MQVRFVVGEIETLDLAGLDPPGHLLHEILLNLVLVVFGASALLLKFLEVGFFLLYSIHAKMTFLALIFSKSKCLLHPSKFIVRGVRVRNPFELLPLFDVSVLYFGK